MSGIGRQLRTVDVACPAPWPCPAAEPMLAERGVIGPPRRYFSNFFNHLETTWYDTKRISPHAEKGPEMLPDHEDHRRMIKKQETSLPSKQHVGILATAMQRGALASV